MVYKRSRNLSRSQNRNRNLSKVGIGTIINSYDSATLPYRYRTCVQFKLELAFGSCRHLIFSFFALVTTLMNSRLRFCHNLAFAWALKTAGFPHTRRLSSRWDKHYDAGLLRHHQLLRRSRREIRQIQREAGPRGAAHPRRHVCLHCRRLSGLAGGPGALAASLCRLFWDAADGVRALREFSQPVGRKSRLCRVIESKRCNIFSYFRLPIKTWNRVDNHGNSSIFLIQFISGFFYKFQPICQPYFDRPWSLVL